MVHLNPLARAIVLLRGNDLITLTQEYRGLTQSQKTMSHSDCWHSSARGNVHSYSREPNHTTGPPAAVHTPGVDLYHPTTFIFIYDNAISIINSRLKDGIPPSKLIRLHQMVTKDHLCRDSIDLNRRGTDIKRNATKITKSLFSTSSMYETKITKILLSTYSKQDLILIGMPCGKNYKNLVLDLFHARLSITKNATNYKNVLDLCHARFDITRSATKITKKVLEIFHARRITRNETKMTKILFLTSSMQGLILQRMQHKLQKSCSWVFNIQNICFSSLIDRDTLTITSPKIDVPYLWIRPLCLVPLNLSYGQTRQNFGKLI